jgi:hypothetical protein
VSTIVNRQAAAAGLPLAGPLAADQTGFKLAARDPVTLWKDHDSFETAFARLLEDLEAEHPAGLGGPSAPTTRPRKPR